MNYVQIPLDFFFKCILETLKKRSEKKNTQPNLSFRNDPVNIRIMDTQNNKSNKNIHTDCRVSGF